MVRLSDHQFQRIVESARTVKDQRTVFHVAVINGHAKCFHMLTCAMKKTFIERRTVSPWAQKILRVRDGKGNMFSDYRVNERSGKPLDPDFVVALERMAEIATRDGPPIAQKSNVAIARPIRGLVGRHLHEVHAENAPSLSSLRGGMPPMVVAEPIHPAADLVVQGTVVSDMRNNGAASHGHELVRAHVVQESTRTRGPSALTQSNSLEEEE